MRPRSMISMSSGIVGGLVKALKWTLGIIFFPVSIPALLVWYFLKKKPDLSKGMKILGSAGIVVGWIVLFSYLPSSPPKDRPLPSAAVQTASDTVAAQPSTSTVNGVGEVKGQAIALIGKQETPAALLAAASSSEPTAPVPSPLPTSTASQAILYSVVRVIDGDTVDLSIGGKTERMRLIGIDTPETVDPRKPVQCFGKEASAKLKALLTGKSVSLETDPSQDERDKYGRMLGYLFLEDGANINLLMIKEGYANEYTYRVPYKYQATFKAAALAAREAKAGLWADDACAGDATQPAPATGQAPASPAPTAPAPSAPAAPAEPSSGVVKKSANNLCHAPGTTYYSRTKNYTPFDTIEACLKSGGELPER